MAAPSFLRAASVAIGGPGTSPTGNNALTFTLNAGETGLLYFISSGISGETPPAVSSIVGGGSWSKKASKYAGVSDNFATSVEIWATPPGGAAAATTVTVNWTKASDQGAIILLAEAWAGVDHFGNTSSPAAQIGTSSPSTTVATSGPDTVAVACFGYGGNSSSADSQVSGTLRVQSTEPSISGVNCTGAAVDASSAITGTALTLSVSGGAHDFYIATLELQALAVATGPWRRNMAVQQRR